MILLRLFSRQWILTTFLVILAMGVMVRLGFWQLDRLDQRRAFNDQVRSQAEQPILDLRAALESEGLAQEGLEDMEYREVVVTGEYDYSQEVVLRNQAWENQLGVHLYTPLKIEGLESGILVNRGWVPFEDFTEERLSQYKEEGQIEVRGILRKSRQRPDIGRLQDPTPAPGGERLTSFAAANVERIAMQIPYPLQPVYIQQLPEAGRGDLPHRVEHELVLTEGSHLGYAIQWFVFALILGAGYPFFVRKESIGDGRGKAFIKER
jgi:surfeit locus 1 family protein